MDGAITRLRSGAGAVIGLAAVGLVVVMLAASSGVVHLWDTPPPSTGSRPRIGQEAPEVVVPTTVATQEAGDPPDSTVLEIIAVAVLTVLAAAVVYAVIMMLLAGLRRRAPVGSRLPASADHPSAPLPDVHPPVVLDVDAQFAALATGTPRNAIVACWLRLEDDVAAAGLPRHASETSAEFTTRVLASYSLDAGPITELAALYREARFSRHELGQRERDQALAALRRVHAALIAPSRAADLEGAQ